MQSYSKQSEISSQALEGLPEQNLLGMLRSMDIESQLLGLKMLEGFGLSRSMTTDLLALSLFSRHLGLRQQAKEMFMKISSRRMSKALADELNLRKFTPYRNLEWFRLLRRRHIIDGPVLAHYMYKSEMMTLPAYLKYGVDDPQTFFQPFIKGLVLDLSCRALDEVPAQLAELQQIKKVDLSGNVLSQMGRIVGRIPNLESLHASNNQLEKLNPTFACLAKLKELNLAFNKIRKLPAGISKLHQLRRLDLSANELTELPAFLAELPQLNRIEASKNRIGKLPLSIGKMQGLALLDLHQNKLDSLPDGLGHLTKLGRLDLSDNQLSALPESFRKLQALHTLRLCNNHFEEFPQEILGCKQLKSLQLNGNAIYQLPADLSALDGLENLSLGKLQLQDLGPLASLKKLRDLTLELEGQAGLPEPLAGSLEDLVVYNGDHESRSIFFKGLQNFRKLRNIKLFSPFAIAPAQQQSLKKILPDAHFLFQVT